MDSREVFGSVTVRGSCLLYKVLFNETQGLFLKVSLLSHFPFIGFFFSKKTHQPPWNHGIFHFRGLDELMALRFLEVMMCYSREGMFFC